MDKTANEPSPVVLPATTQEMRLPRAILPDYVRIDERTPEERMAFAVAYADHLNYFNAQDEHDGSWRMFVENDPSMYLAVIAHTDLAPLEKFAGIFPAIEQSTNKRNNRRYYRQFLMALIDWSKRVDLWYARLHELQETQLVNELEDAINDKLAPALGLFQYMAQHVPSAVMDDPIKLSLEELSSLWKSTEDFRSICQLLLRDAGVDPVVAFREEAQRVFNLYTDTLNYVIERAAKFIPLSREDSADHAPHTALYMTFLHLFEQAQNELNTLTHRHLDFYYRNLLQQRPDTGIPDQAHVCFQLAPGIRYQLLEKGTRLTAGKDAEGTELHFETNEDLLVNRARIAETKTLFVDRDRFFSAGTDTPVVANIYAAPKANSRDGLGMPLEDDQAGWPTFGKSQLDSHHALRSVPLADVGWIVGSPALELAEGHRSLSVTFEFDNWKLAADGIDLPALIDQVVRNESISREAVLYRFFAHSFKVAVSSSKGWYPIEQYEVTVDLETKTLTFLFTLDKMEPAVVRNEHIDLAAYGKPRWPLLRVQLDSEAPVYAYSFLNGLELRQVVIDTQVTGAQKGLRVYTEIGQVSPDKPFQPFGAIPHIGDSLLIGYRELFLKNSKEASIHLEWQGLPAQPGGWETYYEAYGTEIKNDSFQVQLSTLHKGQWLPREIPNRQTFSLFDTYTVDKGRGPEEFLQREQVIDSIDLEKLNLYPYRNLPEPLAYDAYVPSGFFKLEFTEPDGGFGYDRFPQALSEITTANARNKTDLPIPNRPYIPTIKGVTLDYRSSDRIVVSHEVMQKDEDMTTGDIYHIHPFGLQHVFHDGQASDRTLVPSYNEEGYLLLGIADFEPPDVLTLFFELKQRIAQELLETDPGISFWYMRNDVWVPFEKKDIVSDGTDRFSTSGILSIRVPEGITMGNTILPADLYWIAIAVKDHAMSFPATVKLHTQAITATWDEVGDPSRLQKPLAPGKIQKIAGKLPNIQAVSQPMPSFGGRAVEKERDFYMRVSERLRHKNRAVTGWDFERMVLQEFPYLFMVKATHQDRDFQYTPGSVTMVVVPRLHESESLQSLPMADTGTLERVAAYLRKWSSSFAQINVRNPQYEQLLINCEVRFESPAGSGYYLNKLHEDVSDFLSPWNEEARNNITIGGRMNVNTIQSFVENLPYVDYVTAFSVEQIIESDEGFELIDTARETGDHKEIVSTTPWSILVSAPEHRFTLYDAPSSLEKAKAVLPATEEDEEEDREAPKVAGIDRTEIGLDFIIPGLRPPRQRFVEPSEDDADDGKQYFFIVKTDQS